MANEKIKSLDEYEEFTLSLLKSITLERSCYQKETKAETTNIILFCTNLLEQLNKFKDQHKTHWYNSWYYKKTKYEEFDEFLRFSMKDLIELWWKGTMNSWKTFLLKINIVNIQNKTGNTALHIFAFNGNLEVFQELIKHSNSNIRNKFNNTALHIAAFKNDLEMVKILFENNANSNIDSQDKFGNTALHIAAFKNNLEIVKILIGNNADTSIRNKNGNTALMTIAWQRNNLEIVKILRENAILETASEAFEYLEKDKINKVDYQLRSSSAVSTDKQNAGSAWIHLAQNH